MSASSPPDFVIVGSGINSLVVAAMLGMHGKKVLVLERNERIGGCIRTDVVDGFTHDVMATTCVLFMLSPAYAALGPELEKRGLEFAHPEIPSGVLLPSGESLTLGRDRAANVARFGPQYARDMEQLGADAPFLFALLGGPLRSWTTARLVAKEAWRRGPRGLATFFGEALITARGWLESHYPIPLFQALMAPWVLHTGLGPETAYSGQMAKVIAFALEAAGAPIVKGGAQNLLTAFERLITDHGGSIRVNADVAEVLYPNSRATGVMLASGEKISCSEGVICSTTPSQLYGRLLQGEAPAFRHGKGNMQIHYALSRAPRWANAELGKVALLHLTPGLDGVSKAANEAERGMLPVEPTICVGQPTAFDPSRAPKGQAILWLQLPEAPRHLKGDAAGVINVPADGQWDEITREAYADRIEALLTHHLPDFPATIIKRHCHSPADLEAMNINLVGGDPYGGFCGIDQFFLWRPLKGSVNHTTSVKGLYHIGASTHPGPGLGGGSGYLLAKSLGA